MLANDREILRPLAENVNAVTAFGWGDASDLALSEGLVAEYR